VASAADYHDRLRADTADLHPDNGLARRQGEHSSAAAHKNDGRVSRGPDGSGQVGRRGEMSVVQSAVNLEAPQVTHTQLELLRADPHRRDQAGVCDDRQLLLGGLGVIRPDVRT
jgi:hypothetical protein